MPYFAYNEIARILALISVIIISIKYFKIANTYILKAILLFIIYTFTVNTIASDSIFLLRHLQLYIFLILIFISSIVMRFKTERKQQLLMIILSLNIIALIGTYFGLMLDSHAARALTKASEHGVELTRSGVGGYGTIYMSVLMYPILLIIQKTTKTILIKYLAWINLIGLIMVVLYANFLIAILLLFFQAIYLLAKSTRGNLKLPLFLTIISVILIMYNNLEYIENKTFSMVEDTSLRFKHEDFFSQLNGNQDINKTFSGRYERYERSLRKFFTSPISGVLSFDNIGKHSNILDLFAQFGFFVGFLLLFIIRQLPLKLMKESSFKYKYYFKCFLWSIIIFGLVNNYAMQHGILYILMACIVYNRDIDLNKI